MKTEEFDAICSKLRLDIIEMLHNAGSGHPGGSLSVVEILVALYFSVMHINPPNIHFPERDRFILSKGHAAPGLYAVLAERGYFNKEELSTLRKIGSRLQGHPDMKKTPGLDFSSGSLGQGLSVGCGMALIARLEKLPSRIFVLLGDGELQEGQIWEAVMSAAKYKLSNLIAIVDYNGVQLDGKVSDIMPLEPLVDKWRANSWNVLEADGHSMEDLLKKLEIAEKMKNMPTVIIAKTIKGKGVAFMENNHQWHGKSINDETYMAAMKLLCSTGR